MPSTLDQRRLKDVADALVLSEPSIQELESHIAQLSDAILAAQSLDDLGSVEANNQADKDAMFLAENVMR